MTTDEKLDMLTNLVKENNEQLNVYNKRFDNIETNFENVNCELNAYNKRFDDIENLVRANYKMTEAFYVSQKEANTELFDQIAIISGELEMHNNQISKNTADLRRYI